MRDDVLVVDASASITDVWQAMQAAGLDHAVVHIGGTCAGIVELTEMWMAWSLELAPAARRSVLPLVVPSPCVAPDTGLAELCRVLLSSRFGAVLVLDDAGVMKGVVTTSDLLARLAEES